MRNSFVLFALIMLCSASLLFGQNRSQVRVNGKITDATSGEALPGVNILVQGTLTGTVSEVDGRYSVLVSGSESVLVYSFIGYVSQTVTVGTQSSIDIALSAEVQTLGEVVITAQGRGQKQAVQQQINSNTIKNVVAPDRLQENPDANATEAIGRLPGISVIRSGGEGTGLMIRGLEPRYASVSLNGVQMASTSGDNRGTNISGISQYALQGVEVYKSLTADMEANSVAGTVNLKLREAPQHFHVNLMAQGGYNQLNDYWGNYKLLGEVSNRFLNDKLGILVSVNAERVNRSIQTMSAQYKIDGSDPNGIILLNNDPGIPSVGLNIISSIIYRRSAMVSLDYKLSQNTTLMLYGMYNNSKNDYERQSKNYSMNQAGSVGYSFETRPDNTNNILQTALSGESKFKFLNIKADYGIAYSLGNANNTGSKNWNFNFDNVSSSDITDIEHRKMKPTEIVPLFTDDPSKLYDCYLTGLGVTESKTDDKNIQTYLNVSVPFKIGEQINGSVKLGGIYREKRRKRDDQVGYQNAGANQFLPWILQDSLDWVVIDDVPRLLAVGLEGETVDHFLNGDYNYGTTFNIDRLNQLSNTWTEVSDYAYSLGPSYYLPLVGEVAKLGYSQIVNGCMLNDQDIRETYVAGYIMPEFNITKYVMFMPGLRYEETHANNMKGYYALPPQYPPPVSAPVPGQDTSASRSDQFFLPMIHLRIKPTDKFYMHFSYTKTLSRPDFNAISPNIYVNTGWAPFTYTANNPELKPELWTSYDAQFTFHADKIGLLSVTGFYKTVEDKIWQRSYQRIKGDPIIDPFPDNAVVNVTVWENHPYTAFVEGVELEWQTSFYYLPKPFSFFTLYANYTYTHSETSYPYTDIRSIIPPGGGRPVSVRVDSTTKGPMLYQPQQIANVSLGFNYKGFNAWLSYQYNGLIYTGKNYRGAPRLDSQKEHFNRWDIQLTQKFKIAKLSGFEVIANIANLTNFTESQRLRGDPRLTYQEKFGLTADLGVRYRF
jgi:TonB-dependent receptor